MKQFEKILVSVDDRFEDDPALAWAMDLAEHTSAPLHILDVMPNLNWLTRLNKSHSQETNEVVKGRKSQWLNKVAEKAIARGIKATAEVAIGKTSGSIIDRVVNKGFDIVVRTTRGKFSRTDSYFGRTSMRLLRNCPSAVWLVKPGSKPHFEKVLAAVDLESTELPHDAIAGHNVSLDREILELANSIAHLHSGHVHLLHAWEMFGSNLLHSRMSDDEFANLEMEYRNNLKDSLARLADRGNLRTGQDHMHLFHGDPAFIIPEFVQKEKIDLTIMGTHTRSGLTNFVIGNTAEKILDRIQCSLLAIKPR